VEKEYNCSPLSLRKRGFKEMVLGISVRENKHTARNRTNVGKKDE